MEQGYVYALLLLAGYVVLRITYRAGYIAGITDISEDIKKQLPAMLLEELKK